MNDHDFSSTIDRLPPQSIEAEENILGGCLIDPNAYERIADTLQPEMFYIAAHRDIYQAIRALTNKDKPTDLLTVISWLSDNELLERVGGRNKLMSLVDRTVSAVNIDSLAELVAEKYLRRQLIKAGNEVVRLGYETESEVQQVLERAESKVLDVTGEVFGRKEPVALADIVIHTYQRIEERHTVLKVGDSRIGYPTGFYDLDAMILGFKPGKLITIAGRPGMGKSAFAGNIAINIAQAYNLSCLIFSLEMDKEEWGDRFLSQEAQIESSYLQSGRISQTQWEPLARSVKALADLPVFIDDDPYLTVSAVRAKVKRMIAKQERLGVVVIDYLQLMEGMDSTQNNTVSLQIGKVTRALKQLARECQVPIVILSQLNRSVESRNNKRPTASDLRESGRIEEDSDIILLLYRDESYNPQTPDRGVAEVIIAKNRGGATGNVRLLFDAPYTKFKNMLRPDPNPDES